MSSNDNSFVLEPVGTLRSCFGQKFGTPRQPGLCPHATGHIEMHSPWDTPDAFRGLEAFTHVWLTVIFHQVPHDAPLRPLVRPPRLGGNQRVGVFACRSPFRPGRIGLSVVRHHGWDYLDGKFCLRLSGLDLIDGTPVLDIRPYLPWSDTPADARAGWADAAPDSYLEVAFSALAREQVTELSHHHPDLEALISEVLAQDPRPGYRRGQADERTYGMRLHDLEIHWRTTAKGCIVESVTSNKGVTPY